MHYALIEGDPLKSGEPFTIRLGCDDGYKAAVMRRNRERIFHTLAEG
jgi:hypothetical protein